ncbi:MAG: cupin domain-containing protein [Balneolaceae bacterium]|nr:cupin domain-containing protein [Balneolaceae bacterium]
MKLRISELIDRLNLKSHPEGGYYTEVYRSDGIIETDKDDFPDGRHYSTSIYYLLGSDDQSQFHRIKSDEVWHHYEGSPITIHLISQSGTYRKLNVGKDLEAGQKPQHIVPAGYWFGVTVDDPDRFALCGCTVSPGFDFDDFELADRDDLLAQFPDHEEIIKKLTQV